MIPKRRIGNEPLDVIMKAQLSVDLDFDEAVQSVICASEKTLLPQVPLPARKRGWAAAGKTDHELVGVDAAAKQPFCDADAIPA
jgi:hypothetical protein